MKDMYISRTELSNIIDEYVIGSNAIRDRDIMKDRLIDGFSFYELSDKYNLSLPALRYIINKRNNQVLKHLG